MLQKISRALIYAAVILTPLLVLPFTPNVLDFPKQLIFLVLVLLAAFFWIWEMAAAKRASFKYGLGGALVGLFLLAALASAIFSAYPYGSFWGVPLSASDNFMAALGFALFYFLAQNLFDKQAVKNLLLAAVFPSALACLYGLFQSFGLYLVPAGAGKVSTFNTVGSASSLIFLAAILFSVSLPLMFSSKGWRKWVLAACLAVFGIDLVLFNINFAWVALAFGLLGTFLFAMSSDAFAKKYGRSRAAAFAFLAMAIIFISVNFFAGSLLPSAYAAVYKQIGFAAQPLEFYLTEPTSLAIAADTLRQSAKSFFVGSGPGTFIYDFERFKPAAISQNDNFWNAEFSSGASEIIDILATKGLLGLLAFLLLAGYTTYKGFKLLTGGKAGNETVLALFSGWLAVIAMVFIYPFVFTGAMLFWLFVALFGLVGESKIRSLELRSIKSAYVASLAMIVLLAVEIGFIIWISKRYYAEAKYQAAYEALRKNDIDGALKNLLSASSATQNMQDDYLTDLAQVYLAKSNQLSIQMTGRDAAQKDIINAVAPYLGSSAQAVSMVCDKVNPNSAANWSARGYVMTQLAMLGVFGEATGWAQKSYQRALDLEPANPAIWTQMGQVMLLQKNPDGAKADFQKAVALNPKYSNARYYLGLLDDQQGDKQAAINEFATIAQLNPDNQTIAQILQNLQAGQPALGEPAASQSAAVPPQPQPGVITPASGQPGTGTTDNSQSVSPPTVPADNTASPAAPAPKPAQK